MKNRIGIAGLAVGFVALAGAIFQNKFREATETPPEPEPTLRELAKEAGKNWLKDRILKDEQESPPSKRVAVDQVDLAYMGLGLSAIILGVISWTRKENIRIAGAALSLGLVAVAWQYVLIGIGVAVVLWVFIHLWP